jgi:cation transport ATPase
MPEIEKTDSSVHSLVDVDSPHVSSVPSDFESQSIKTDTQETRIELEERAEAAHHEAQKAKQKAHDKKEKAKRTAKENPENTMLLGNSITVGILGTVLGVGAYRKWSRNELSWKVVAGWGGVVGVFALGDYFFTRYILQKYPQKK